MTQDQYAKKWYKYLNKALTTKNPNMRKFFAQKAKDYAVLTMPGLKVYYKDTSNSYAPPKDRYVVLRDKMIDE